MSIPIQAPVEVITPVARALPPRKLGWAKLGRRSLFVVAVLGVCFALELPRERHRRVAPAAAAPIASATPQVPTAATATAVAQPAAKPGTLVVRVTADGMPRIGAEVSISDGSRPTLATTLTDLEGVAHFADLAPGPYEVWARQDAMVSKLARIGELANQPDVSVELAPGGVLRGAVIADLAAPKDATVTLIPIDVDHVVRVAQADPTGKFSISGLPLGHWRVEISAAGHVQDGDQTIEVKADPDDVTVRMQRAGAVIGTVVDGSGTPVAAATIILRKQGEGAELAERPVISTRIRWVHPLAGRRVLPPGENLRFGASRPGSRPAECGQGHCGVDIGWIRGTVVHAAADGEIAIAHAESVGEAGRAIAIDHGNGLKTYYMHLDELRPGLELGQKIRAGDAIGAMGATGFASGPHLHFAMTQERDGRTWYVDPEPILRHAVVLAEPRALDPIDAKDARVIAAVARPAATSEPKSISTDARGQFRIDGVAPGTYVAVAFASDLAPGTSTVFAVTSGGNTGDVAIAMHPGVLVVGRVMGRDGPVIGATVVAGASTGESAHKVAAATTSAQGEFSLRALTGSITLAITAPGYGVVERVISLGDGGPNAPRHREDFTLAIENAQLRGQVLAPDGGPAGVVTVRVIDGPTRRQVTSDASGKFTVDRVASGSYQLEAVSPEFPAVKIAAETDRWTDIRLVAGGSVSCEVRDPNGPAAGIRIDATGPGNRTQTATSDAHGSASLRALVPGEWTVRIRAKGYTESRRAITVRASSVPGELRFDLARSATLAGVVRDRQGRRVAGAKVFVDGGASAQTDAEGNFRLADAPAGGYWLEAELEGAHGAIQLQLEPGAERMTLEIQIQ